MWRHCHYQSAPRAESLTGARRVSVARVTGRSGRVWDLVLFLWIITRQILTNQSWCNRAFVFFKSSFHFKFKFNHRTQINHSYRETLSIGDVNNSTTTCLYWYPPHRALYTKSDEAGVISMVQLLVIFSLLTCYGWITKASMQWLIGRAIYTFVIIYM